MMSAMSALRGGSMFSSIRMVVVTMMKTMQNGNTDDGDDGFLDFGFGFLYRLSPTRYCLKRAHSIQYCRDPC